MNELLVFAMIGVFIVILSYFIRFRKQAHLISGYDEEEILDKDGFCNWFGGVFMLVGFFAIITGGVLYWKPDQFTPVVIVFGVIVVIALVVAIVGGKKYRKQY